MFKRILTMLSDSIEKLSPQLLLIYTFALLIIIGTLALMLPEVQNEPVGLLDALFTATSATCVTGLATIDIADSFNWYGQFIILVLIQLGGVGLMTFAALSFSLMGVRLSLGTRDVLDDTLLIRNSTREFLRTFKLMFWIILNIEFIGAFFIFWGFFFEHKFGDSVWNACFLSVSAFCNAGFSLLKDSLNGTSHYTQVVIMVLIILGGLGHLVLAELLNFFKALLPRGKTPKIRFFSYHVKVVLLTTGILLILGTVATYVFNLNNKDITWFDSLFQAVTARTAGFSTLDQTLFTTPSILILMLMMFIGGGSGSCAGGIKTTTLAIWLAHVRQIIRGKNEITLLGRKIPAIIVNRVSQVIALALFWNILGLIVLSAAEEYTPLQTLVFEQVSAFATVGLSLDFTDQLSYISRIWIILTMFVGRLGTLTIALAIPRAQPLNINHPEGRILVG